MDKSGNKDIKKSGAAVCVFCGSSFGHDPAFREAARAIGAGIAKMGYLLVFGGGGLGLMGEVARAALDGGGDIQGIMPGFLQALEPEVSPQEKLIVTPHLQERKTLMLQMSDAFLVLPGGLGTFDEFFEVAVEAQLHVHNKPIIVVNVQGYYDALDGMLHKTIEAGFAKETVLKLYYLADGAEAALDILEGALSTPVRS
ncbi:MAG TPA: TIGR00730 family Rossman fold protein [Rhizomicrobium sp.]|nr:TIGR00730 family Rossman fold protein [Rhizomicrobium sp.]